MTTSTFFTEPLTDYFESLWSCQVSPKIILGDFNIHMDLTVGYTGVHGSHMFVIAACPCIGELFSDHFPVIVFHFPDKLDTLNDKKTNKIEEFVCLSLSSMNNICAQPHCEWREDIF